jgi:serine/threonine-protein kinase RIO1
MINTVDIQNNTVIKTVKKPFLDVTQTWFNYYTKLSKRNQYLVKVLDIDPDKNIIIMENLGEVISVEQYLKDYYLRPYITKELVCDIILALNTSWTQSINFSKTLPDDNFFVHTDLSLNNIVITKDKKVKVIDPDSYVIVDKLQYTERFYMSQISLMANLGFYYNNLRVNED